MEAAHQGLKGPKLRAHHLLCIHGFRGQGYSPAFVANMARLVERLSTSPNDSVTITCGADDICFSCPHLKAGICSRAAGEVDSIDRRVMNRLSLVEGDILSWSSLLDKIRKRIKSTDLSEICGDCHWIKFGYCSAGLADLTGGGMPKTNSKTSTP